MLREASQQQESNDDSSIKGAPSLNGGRPQRRTKSKQTFISYTLCLILQNLCPPRDLLGSKVYLADPTILRPILHYNQILTALYFRTFQKVRTMTLSMIWAWKIRQDNLSNSPMACLLSPPQLPQKLALMSPRPSTQPQRQHLQKDRPARQREARLRMSTAKKVSLNQS